MSHVAKSALVPFSAEQMYLLVNDVQHYPAFLPWCSSATVLSQHDNTLDAQVTIDVKGIKKSFTTRNTATPHSRIDLVLVDGPFSSLTGYWAFQILKEDACKVMLTLDFEFSNQLLAATIGPVFNHIANTMVDAFSQRAHNVYPLPQ